MKNKVKSVALSSYVNLSRLNTLVMGMFLLLSSMAFIACSSSKSPGDVVQGFFKAVESGDTKAAMKLYHIRDEDRQKMKENPFTENSDVDAEEKIEALLVMYAAGLKMQGGIKKFDVVSEEIDGDNAKVTLKITFGKGETEEKEFELLKVKGEWKLVDLQ